MNINRNIGPETRRFAVLGEALGHTWSPYIHNTLFSASGTDAVYLPMTIDRDHLSSAADVLRHCYSGFNVTIPYKERIIPFLDELDARARAMAAVNTVEVREGRLIGHITDGLGMMRAIKGAGIETDGIHALILGGGGAARVGAYEILERGGTVVFALRSPEKAETLVSSFENAFNDARQRISVCPLEEIRDSYDLLINCTPVGMYPKGDVCPVSEETFSRVSAVFDAVYNPRETRLLSQARAKGIPCAEGFGMLFYQAVEAQRFWDESMLPDPDIQADILRTFLSEF